ncbi:hypothetical protein J7L48_07455 [bacterium]|nr:hypothetical protein [bacterium]
MKLKWQRPVLKKIIIDKRCNPAHPQWVTCNANNPQTAASCTKNKIGLS